MECFMSLGECTKNRLELSAKAYAEEFGTEALATFLEEMEDVASIEEVLEGDRFRVNKALRGAIPDARKSRPKSPPISMPDVLAQIGKRAFARMVRK
jgi:hypothetical protein